MGVRVFGEPVVVAMRKVTLNGAEGFRIDSANPVLRSTGEGVRQSDKAFIIIESNSDTLGVLRCVRFGAGI